MSEEPEAPCQPEEPCDPEGPCEEEPETEGTTDHAPAPLSEQEG